MKFQNVSKVCQTVYLPSKCDGIWPTDRTIIDVGLVVDVEDDRDISKLKGLASFAEFPADGDPDGRLNYKRSRMSR